MEPEDFELLARQGIGVMGGLFELSDVRASFCSDYGSKGGAATSADAQRQAFIGAVKGLLANRMVKQDSSNGPTGKANPPPSATRAMGGSLRAICFRTVVRPFVLAPNGGC